MLREGTLFTLVVLSRYWQSQKTCVLKLMQDKESRKIYVVVMCKTSAYVRYHADHISTCHSRVTPHVAPH